MQITGQKKIYEYPPLTTHGEAGLVFQLTPGQGHGGRGGPAPDAHPSRFSFTVHAVKARDLSRRKRSKLAVSLALFRAASAPGSGSGMDKSGLPNRWTIGTPCCGWASEAITVCSSPPVTRFRCTRCKKRMDKNFGGGRSSDVHWDFLEELFLEHHLQSGHNFLQAHLSIVQWRAAAETLFTSFQLALKEQCEQRRCPCAIL